MSWGFNFAFILLATLSAAWAQVEKERFLDRGKIRIVLQLPPDGLYAREEMQVEFRILDTSQRTSSNEAPPVSYARAQAVVDMPDMPGMPAFQEIAHSEGIPGLYGVHPTFPHGGEYRLVIKLLSPDEQPATLTGKEEQVAFVFPLHVEDDSTHAPAFRVQAFSLQTKFAPVELQAGSPVDFEFAVRRESVTRRLPDGREIKENVSAFEPVHEKLMHLFVVRDDLGTFAHEHPALGNDGIFRLRLVFPTRGNYRLFADVAPKGAGSQVLSTKVAVGGVSGERFNLPAAAPQVLDKRTGTIRVQCDMPVNRLPSRKTQTVRLRLSDMSDRPVVNLQPWLGAMGHLLLVHQDGETFAHAHPDERSGTVGKDGVLPFLVRLPKPGLYRAWLQVMRDGHIVTIDFLLNGTS